MRYALTLAAACAAATPAFAADPPVQTRPVRGQQAAANFAPAGDASAVSGPALAAWIAQDNEAELALAQFAEQKTNNPAVREFAGKMIQAHRQFGQQLRQAASEAGDGRTTTPRRAGFRPDADPTGTAGEDGGDLDPLDGPLGADPAVTDPVIDRPAGDLEGRNAEGEFLEDGFAADGAGTGAALPPANSYRAGAARPNGPGLREGREATAGDLLAFRANLKKQCGETLKENFDKLSPADFDKGYASQQIGAHLAMLDTLTLAERNAEGPLKQVFADGKRQVQGHLTEAIGLLNSVTPPNPARR